MLAIAATTLLTQSAVQAPGAMWTPASRTYACYVDGLTGGQIIPKNPACAAAVAAGGTQPLYDYYGVLRSDGAGRTSGFIADGQLCSGGNTKYAAYDAARTDWPTTTLQPNVAFDFTYGAWVPHPGGFKLYVTKDTWDPLRPLAWSDLEAAPFLTVDPAAAPSNGAYHLAGRTPNKTGRHIIYSVWYRSDSAETFYGCSDVIFSGSGSSASPSTPASSSAAPSRSASASGSASVSPSVPAGTGSCSATVTLDSTWQGGFQGSATIRNTGTTVINSWYVSWTISTGATVTQAWNGTLMVSGPSIMVHAPSWALTLAPGASATAGFMGTSSAAPTFTAVGCG